jgi:hypothetical protein
VRRQFFHARDNIRGTAAEAHAIRRLSGAIQLHGIGGLAAARHGSFGVDEVFVDGSEPRGRGHRLRVGILAVEIGDVFEGLLPRSLVDFERNCGLDRKERRRLGEIVDGICVGTEALEFGLFFGKRLAGIFVGIISSEPNLPAKRDGVIVKGENSEFPFAARVEAILFVITDAHDDAQDAIMAVLAFAERAESSFGGKIVHIVDPILDEIGPLDLVHFELRFRTVELREQGFEQAITFRRGVGGGHGGVSGWF